jgi:WD40 repeat protein
VAFSADGRQLLAGCTQDVRRWDIETGDESIVLKDLVGPVVAFASDARRIACAARFALSGKSNVDLYDSASGKLLLTFNPLGEWNRRFPFRPVVAALAHSPDRKSVV